MKSLADKNVIITGAASGIGKEMAQLFAKEKSNLAILDINQDHLEKTRRMLENLGTRVRSYVCDVSNRENIESAAKQIKTDFTTIDILINNAGIAIGNTVADSSYEDIRKTIDINLIGLIWMTKQFLPQMMERNSGHIVNIASAMGLQAVPKMADYVATKFAIVGYSDTLRIEMKKYGYKGVKVTIACPSGVNTGMFEGYKPPILSPILKKEVVAKKIVTAVKKERSYVKLPFVIKVIPFIKGLPPVILDPLAAILGLYKSMDDLKSSSK